MVVVSPPAMKTVIVTCMNPHPDLKKDTAWAKANRGKQCGYYVSINIEDFYEGPLSLTCPRCGHIAVFR